MRSMTDEGRRGLVGTSPEPSSDLASRGHLLPRVGEGRAPPTSPKPQRAPSCRTSSRPRVFFARELNPWPRAIRRPGVLHGRWRRRRCPSLMDRRNSCRRPARPVLPAGSGRLRRSAQSRPPTSPGGRWIFRRATTSSPARAPMSRSASRIFARLRKLMICCGSSSRRARIRLSACRGACARAVARPARAPRA